MELSAFKKHFQNYFQEKGFEKIKNKYYLKDEQFVCVIDMQRSYYGPTYYINCLFFIGKFEKPYAINQDSIETYTPFVESRFYFSEKHKYSCDYLDYTEEELTRIFDDNYSKIIKPPFEEGKKYFLEHFRTLYTTFLRDERIRPFLENETNTQLQ